MAKILNNSVPGTNSEKSYKVVIGTRKEFMAAFENGGRCHLCNDELMLDDTMYYIPVLDVVYCYRCYSLWNSSVQYFKVDKPIENSRLMNIMEKFKDIGCWVE